MIVRTLAAKWAVNPQATAGRDISTTMQNAGRMPGRKV
jgi:hypothetical protein